MPKSTKAARHISVFGVKYMWRAKGGDGWISVTVWPDGLAGPTMACTFDYEQTVIDVRGCQTLRHQLVVTNRIVRRIIEYAVRERGYSPHTKSTQLNLGRLSGVVDTGDAVRSR
jgi:hypothetical protein